MKAFTILIMALVAVCFSTTDGIGKVIFVDTDATGSSNGTSWADAYTELQSALAEAQANDEIWVAEGTYKPTAGLDRTISFSMKNGVAIYGGFDPTDGDIDFADRDWENNITVLSGNIGNVASRADNSYHVFFHPVGTDLDGTAILDGFTISGGNANGSFPHSRGGGMVNEESSPTLSNCTFSGNSTNIGGGMFNNNSSPILTNCIMWGDIPNEIYNVGTSSPDITYSTIQGGHGGAGNLDQNPAFGRLGVYLTATSPCIDAGTSAGAPATDIEGQPRPSGEGVDMGADEFYGGCTALSGDLDCDNDVDGSDLADFAAAFGLAF